MDLTLVFKALHILSMFAMVTVFLGGELFYSVPVWRRDVAGLAWVHHVEARTRLGPVGVAFLVMGVAFGLLAAATGGFDFFSGWLIAAYALIAAFLINVALVGLRLVRLADKAVEAEAGHRPTEEVVREMAASPAVAFFFPVNIVIFAAIILDMVLKPF